MLASRGGHIKCIELLIKYSADINIIDRIGQNALHYACYDGHKKCIRK